jgi:spore germination protein
LAILKKGDCMEKELNKIKQEIKKQFGDSTDLVFRLIKTKEQELMYVYLESVTSDDKVSNFLMKDLGYYVRNKKEKNFDSLFHMLENSIYNSQLYIEENLEDIYYKLASGYTIIFIEGETKAISIETKANLNRGITESTSETIVRGPKDGFNENYSTNIGLIRKRIKTNKLWFKEHIVGRKTKTKVSVAFIEDVVDLKRVEKIEKIIDSIDIDGVLDSGYIRDFLIKKNPSSLPKIKSSERPDVASTALLEGKIVILVENSPFVLITPTVLTDFIHTPEDYYQKTDNINFTRILRCLALFLTILTPAFYIAVTTFNQEMIPNELLISLAIQQDGVPFPTAFEVIMMMITFEILRESNIRIPSPMGAAISIVGALVLGDAAVSAGIVSPIVIIVVAITSICGLLFTDIDFVNALRIWRLIFIIFATIAGLIGIVVAGIIFVTKLASVTTDEVPYLAPFSPLNFRALSDSVILFPFNKLKYRPSYLAEKNQTKLGDQHE